MHKRSSSLMDTPQFKNCLERTKGKFHKVREPPTHAEKGPGTQQQSVSDCWMNEQIVFLFMACKTFLSVHINLKRKRDWYIITTSLTGGTETLHSNIWKHLKGKAKVTLPIIITPWQGSAVFCLSYKIPPFLKTPSKAVEMAPFIFCNGYAAK